MTPIDTHFYDGKLENSMNSIIEHLKRVHGLNIEKKKTCLDEIKIRISDRCNVLELEALDRLITQKIELLDESNNLYVKDLLFLCYEKIVIEQNEDFVQEFLIQLQDMHTGFCVQGCTTRLLQILLPYF